jgi:hypothetical protein
MIVPGHRSVDPSLAPSVTSRLRAAGCLPIEIINVKETDHEDVSRSMCRGGCGMGIASWIVQVYSQLSSLPMSQTAGTVSSLCTPYVTLHIKPP